jgi:hypothetical protein
MEPRALCMLGKYATTELHPQPKPAALIHCWSCRSFSLLLRIWRYHWGLANWERAPGLWLVWYRSNLLQDIFFWSFP